MPSFFANVLKCLIAKNCLGVTRTETGDTGTGSRQTFATTHLTVQILPLLDKFHEPRAAT